MRPTSAVFLFALLAAACSNPTGAERAPGYFDGLRPVAREVTGAIADVGGVFELAHESKTLRATALTDLRAGDDLAIVNPAAADRLFSAVEALSAVEVPEDRRADHDTIVALLLDAAGFHGAGGSLESLPGLFCDAAAGLSLETAILTDVLFRDDDLDCEPG